MSRPACDLLTPNPMIQWSLAIKEKVSCQCIFDNQSEPTIPELVERNATVWA
jgi:hypothetical protein